MENKIVLATSNLGKIAEIELALRSLPFTLLPQDHFFIPICEETGLSFIENALQKARHTSKHTKLPALADDSGLIVPALNDEPGLYSARYAGQNVDRQAHWQKLLTKLREKNHPERKAYFYCCLVFMKHENDPTPLIAEGLWEGMIGFEPQGEEGFGYDPLFYLPQLQCTAAQLSLEEKNKISHRAKALMKLKDALLQLDQNKPSF
ncbi:MAG: hypothetical protein ACD_44C00394G0002 [uncultured bacterium]|nr:MAG: hypothetical protein ACD_44C00394G0002 [uncultured bacterium]OGT67511.1 MAG: non-canonical purine NTP pyrophosphatase, RdgB/HAM1 family [Gammaproteobacteria bacterium RIFCSPLOWO2_02_FULL_38_11]